MSELMLGGSWAGGWDEPGVLSIVLIGAGSPGQGLFVYDTAAPQLNHLIASIAPAAGTDTVGNNYVAGIASYGTSTAIFAELFQATLLMQQIGGHQAQLSIPGAGALANYLRFTLATGYAFDAGILATSATGFVPGSTTTAETWHNMTLLNSWANNGSFTASRYRFTPVGPAGSVEIMGVINANAATATTFFTLPSGYIPATVGGFAAGANAGVAANAVANIRWDASGNLTVNNMTVPSASSVLFAGSIPLD